MSNQADKSSTAIYIRMPSSLKKEIEKAVDYLNEIQPGANYTISSWVRAAIDDRLQRSKK